jgi:hypothetical protein
MPGTSGYSARRRSLLECVRLSREIFAQPAFAPYRGEEIFPGESSTKEAGGRIAFSEDR